MILQELAPPDKDGANKTGQFTTPRHSNNSDPCVAMQDPQGLSLQRTSEAAGHVKHSLAPHTTVADHDLVARF